MSQAPRDDLPQPYGPGWWDTSPGEAAAPPPEAPRPPVRTLGEYMAAVRAAVPYLDSGDGRQRPGEPHQEEARSLLGRLARAAARVVSGSPQPAGPAPRVEDPAGTAPASLSAGTPGDAPPPAGRARTRG